MHVNYDTMSAEYAERSMILLSAKDITKYGS